MNLEWSILKDSKSWIPGEFNKSVRLDRIEHWHDTHLSKWQLSVRIVPIWRDFARKESDLRLQNTARVR